MSQRRAAAPADRPRRLCEPGDGLIRVVPVGEVARAMAFYGLLGLTVDETQGVGEQLDWAALSHDDARIMLAGAGEPIDADDQAVLFYLFTVDLLALQQHALGFFKLKPERKVGSGQLGGVAPTVGFQRPVAQLDGHVLLAGGSHAKAGARNALAMPEFVAMHIGVGAMAKDALS